jgi:hypothetical protein
MIPASIVKSLMYDRKWGRMAHITHSNYPKSKAANKKNRTREQAVKEPFVE